MTCAEVRRLLPGYLDGALPEKASANGHARVGEHLESCKQCRQELVSYVLMSMMMSAVTPPAAPADLGVRIRVAVAQARAIEGVAGRMRRWKDRGELLLENILEPLALPATGGLVVALLVFLMVYQVLGVGMPLSAAVHDSPTNLLLPARLESLAPFSMSELEEKEPMGAHQLLVEATVNANGEAASYQILSGQVDPAMRHELDQVVLFSRFQPELSFGRPTSNGRVLLSFNKIRVRG
jgi:hypothetical protein